MKACRLIVVRLLLGLLTLFFVSLVIFWGVELLPGDVANRILGRLATEENLTILRARMHLDEPAVSRYLTWFGDIVTGDLGRTLSSNRPVIEVLGPRIGNTLILAAIALAIYVPLVMMPAIVQAVYRDTMVDHVLSFITLVIYSIPDFLIGTILLLVFVVALPLLPATSVVDADTTWREFVSAVTLPAFTLGCVMAVYAVRMLRDSLVDILDADFIRIAVLNGIPWSRVIWRHALPNALVPTLNITALNIAYLIGGVVIVEKVFSYPGFGSLLVDALLLRDLPLIQITVLIAAATYILANILADVAAVLLNPKLRT